MAGESNPQRRGEVFSGHGLPLDGLADEPFVIGLVEWTRQEVEKMDRRPEDGQ